MLMTDPTTYFTLPQVSNATEYHRQTDKITNLEKRLSWSKAKSKGKRNRARRQARKAKLSAVLIQ